MTYMTPCGQGSYTGICGGAGPSTSYSEEPAKQSYMSGKDMYRKSRDLDNPTFSPESAYQSVWKADNRMYDSAQITFGTGMDPGKYGHGKIDLTPKID